MKKYYLIVTVGISLFLFSCTSQKNLIYLQGAEDAAGESVYNYPANTTNYSPNYLLAEQDMLYIQINSNIGEEASKLCNIYVKGLTIEQAENKIKEKAEEYVEGVIVSCKMVNYKVSILGEVTRPGTYTFYQPSVSVFDVIAAAGDLTYYGNRHRVKIVRKTPNEDIIYNIDLTESSILQNSKYYLQPGDIVYVEPNKNTKALTTLNVPLNTITSSLSIITSIVSVLSLILALNKK